MSGPRPRENPDYEPPADQDGVVAPDIRKEGANSLPSWFGFPSLARSLEWRRANGWGPLFSIVAIVGLGALGYHYFDGESGAA